MGKNRDHGKEYNNEGPNLNVLTKTWDKLWWQDPSGDKSTKLPEIFPIVLVQLYWKTDEKSYNK